MSFLQRAPKLRPVILFWSSEWFSTVPPDSAEIVIGEVLPEVIGIVRCVKMATLNAQSLRFQSFFRAHLARFEISTLLTLKARRALRSRHREGRDDRWRHRVRQ